MPVVQVTVGSALMPLRIEDAVVAESKSARFDKYAVFQGESSVEYIYLEEASPNTRPSIVSALNLP